MKYGVFPFLFALLSWLPWAARAGLREASCEYLGGYLDTENCESASFNEYNLISNCVTVYGSAYRHAGVNADEFRAYGHESAQGYADELTNQLVYSLAAKSVYEANSCQLDFYQRFAKADDRNSQDLEKHVKEAFAAALPQMQARIPPQDPTVVLRSREDRFKGRARQTGPGGEQKQLEIAMRDSVERPLIEFDALAATIPMGGRDEVRAIVAKAALENWSQDRFMAAYRAVMKSYAQESRVSLANISANISQHHCGRNGGEGICFNVQAGERGVANFRQTLLDSGIVENVLVSSGVAKQLDRGYLCRLRRHRRGCVAVSAIEVAGSVLLPYAAASLGLRAGLALARVGIAAEQATFLAHAISRGLIFGGYAAQMALASDDVLRDCFNKHTGYLASKETQKCEPERQFYEIRAEASIGACISSAVLGLAPMAATASLDLLTAANRINKTSGVINAAADLRAAGRVADEVVDPVVVTGTAARRDFFLSQKESKRIGDELAARDIRRTTSLDETAVRSLSDEERVFLIEEGSGSALTKSQASDVLALLKRGKPLSQNEEKSFKLILQSAGVDEKKVDAAFDSLGARGVLGRPVAKRALAGDDGAPYFDEVMREKVAKQFAYPPAELDMGLATTLNDHQRIYAVEELAGVRLSRAEAADILTAHGRGSIGHYTFEDYRARAETLRRILRDHDVPDEKIRMITRDLIQKYVLGKQAPAPSLVQRFLNRLGLGPRNTPAISPTRAITDDAATIARQGFKEDGSEVLDPNLQSAQAQLALSTKADDLFNPVFTGNVHEMIQRQLFRLKTIGNMDGSFWWRASDFIPGARSRSPLAKVYADLAGGIDNVRRQAFWPVKQIINGPGSSFVTSFDDQRVVVNQIRNAAGVWEDKSIEVIAKATDGSYAPFFYVKQGDKWVLSRTFRGEPVERACIACHHHPSNAKVFTAIPYSALRAPHPVHSAGVPVQRIDVNDATAVSQEFSRIYGGGESISARTADMGRSPSRAPLTVAARELSPGDKFRLADELLPGRGFVGEDANVVRRKTLIEVGKRPAAEAPTYLRYGKTAGELKAYRDAHNGANPPEIFSESDAAMLIEKGFSQAP